MSDEESAFICYACANGRHGDCIGEACECPHHASPPESETPETDAICSPGYSSQLATLARSLERRLAQAQACVAELEKALLSYGERNTLPDAVPKDRT